MTGTAAASVNAQQWGSLWGARTRDYANLAEGCFRPVYERVFTETDVRPGTRLLDVGCGPGLAAQIAAQRGAHVAGLDAAEASLAIARERTPGGDFRRGDLQALPWADRSFDVVTGFNAFQFADDPQRAVQEARRVLSPGGRLAIVVWGARVDCDIFAVTDAVATLLPGSRPRQVDAFAAERIGSLLHFAGLRLISTGQVDAILDPDDYEAAQRALMSAGPSVAALQQVGEPLVRQAIARSLTPFRTATGGYRLHNVLRYVISSAVRTPRRLLTSHGGTEPEVGGAP
ncbi:MAG TPA: class I SAM-dependent methyltransferase [Chloroflexota bacterium]